MFVTRLVLHNNLILFGSPASTVFRSTSRPTAVTLTGAWAAEMVEDAITEAPGPVSPIPEDLDWFEEAVAMMGAERRPERPLL